MQKGLSIFTVISVVLLCKCLVFLTTINFFLYPSSSNRIYHQQKGDTQTPIEEKSNSSNSSVIQEEYIHQTSCIPMYYEEHLSREYNSYIASFLPIVHYELVSPPPKSMM